MRETTAQVSYRFSTDLLDRRWGWVVDHGDNVGDSGNAVNFVVGFAFIFLADFIIIAAFF